jgi:putative peptide zinc metalloprotease protein
MSNMTSALVSTPVLHLKPRRRRDLQVVQRRSAGRSHWVIKDPMQLNYFFFDSFQHWLFQKLDGGTTVAEIEAAFNRAFAPARITAAEIVSFCARLSHDGLLCDNATGQHIRQRRAKKLKSRMWRLPLSFLAIRLRGIDAKPIAALAEAFMGWMFTWPAVLLFSALFLLSLVFGIQVADQIVAEFPSMGQIRAVDVISFLLAISAVKILHELGHAACCQKMGAECSELGIMFLVFSPCLYCNVSDAWMLKSKWRRIAISAAGIYVELVIASVTVFLWYYCESEILRSLFLNVFIVCSLNTLLLNGNPLMRYDGYYILSDLVDVPNLSQQSQKTAWNWLSQLVFKSDPKENTWISPSMQVLEIMYYFVSLVYRAIILIAIFWVAYKLTKPAGLSPLVLFLAALFAATAVFSFNFTLGTFILRKNRSERLRPLGIMMGLAILVGVLYFVGQIKVPYRIPADAVIQLEDFHYCIAKTPGTLLWAIDPCVSVKTGDCLARLEDQQLQRELLELQGRIAAEQLHIQNLITQSAFENESRYHIPAAEARLADLNQQLAIAQQKLSELEIASPSAGVVMLPGLKAAEDENNVALAAWDGTPLDTRNQGCQIEEGDLICLVATPNRWNAYAIIDERKLDLISPGDPVQIQSSLEVGQIYDGTIGDIAIAETIDPGADQRLKPLPTAVSNTTYRAQVKLERPLSLGIHGAKAKARIEVKKETLFQIARRYLTETFRMEF